MNIKVDSKKVTRGDTFIAIGNGHNYIEEAIKNGASKVIVEHGIYDVETIIVEDTHKYLVDYLYDNYYETISKVKLIGVTGTNGKTTTCYLIYQALNKLGIKCAYIGTIGFYINDEIRPLRNTTPDIYEIYDMLLECVNNDIFYVSMECSSQGLDMNRLERLKFEYGIYTNLTSEHLDYHKTMDNYALAKLKLFKNCNKRIINIDDSYSKIFLTNDCITYSLSGNYKIDMKGTTFNYKDKIYHTNLIGVHNIYNLLSVLCLLDDLHLDCKVIENLSCPVGRMDVVKYKDNLIIIDYAHTPDAVSNILNSVKELNPNNIITILGCGGNRDKYKRPIMGSIAVSNSSYTIITSDNPRDEDPSIIANDMIQTLDKKTYEILLNREKAIIKGIQMLKNSDILLVLGKGHETYQTINGIRYDFDDKKIVLDNI